MEAVKIICVHQVGKDQTAVQHAMVDGSVGIACIAVTVSIRRLVTKLMVAVPLVHVQKVGKATVVAKNATLAHLG